MSSKIPCNPNAAHLCYGAEMKLKRKAQEADGKDQLNCLCTVSTRPNVIQIN